MDYKNVGRSGLLVSSVGVGCNQFGGRVDASTTKAIVEKAVSLGVTYFDTSDVYNEGRSEEFLGAALRPYRKDVVIATKSKLPMRKGPYGSGASRRYLMDALEDCLRRLQTDYIDLYQMHTWDAQTPIEETLRALDDMVRSGKVRYVGSDYYNAWQIVESEWTARSNHLEHFISAIGTYNLLEREVEKDIIPVCQRYGIGFIPVFPLAQGFLTGKYRPDQPAPEGARLSDGSQWSKRVLSEGNFAILARLEEFSAKCGRTLLELSIGWLLSQPFVPSVIAGVTRPEQIEENVRAGDVRLSSDEMAELDAILNGKAA